MEKTRCGWATHPLDIKYHDEEWGRPLHDDQRLFEFLILEGMQAGLSWLTVLKKRETMRNAFDGFDPAILSRYDDQKMESLLQNPGIIRNRLKLKSLAANAQAYFRVKEEYGSLNNFLWGYVDGKPIRNHWKDLSEVPVKTALSDTISKDMKKLGFKFVGSTIIYAYLQAIGIVDDHLEGCFVKKLLYSD